MAALLVGRELFSLSRAHQPCVTDSCEPPLQTVMFEFVNLDLSQICLNCGPLKVKYWEQWIFQVFLIGTPKQL